MSRPPIWQMIQEAIHELNGRATYTQIRDWIYSKYGSSVNENTIRAQIIICTVNHPSRIHYPENKKPRNANSKYDFLYSVGRGEVVLYKPEQHGQWSIIIDKDGRLQIHQDVMSNGITEIQGDLGNDEEKEDDDLLIATEVSFSSSSSSSSSFALESHLRDYLANNLESVEKGLRLYHDENKRDGVEYPTSTGPIDILAIDAQENFVVFELKLLKGQDRAIGQLFRYMGWVSENLAKAGSGGSRKVRGYIVAKSISDGPKYAAKINPQIGLLEYELKFAVKPAAQLQQ